MSIEHKVRNCNEDTKQPDWGRGHVRLSEELEIGTAYNYYEEFLSPSNGEQHSFRTVGRKGILEVIEAPAPGKKAIRVVISNGQRPQPELKSFTALGLVRYADGSWSKSWIEDPARTKPSLMEKLLSVYPEYFSAIDCSNFD